MENTEIYRMAKIGVNFKEILFWFTSSTKCWIRDIQIISKSKTGITHIIQYNEHTPFGVHKTKRRIKTDILNSLLKKIVVK